jgi:hypothetical protein
MCVSLPVRSRKIQVTVSFWGHFRTVGPQYGTFFMFSFLAPRHSRWLLEFKRICGHLAWPLFRYLSVTEVFVVGVLAIRCNCFIWIIIDFHLFLCGLHSSCPILVSNHKIRKCILIPSSSGKVRKSLLSCYVLGYSYSETRYSSSAWRSNKIRNSSPSPRFKTEYANAAYLKTNLQQGRN